MSEANVQFDGDVIKFLHAESSEWESKVTSVLPLKKKAKLAQDSKRRNILPPCPEKLVQFSNEGLALLKKKGFPEGGVATASLPTAQSMRSSIAVLINRLIMCMHVVDETKCKLVSDQNSSCLKMATLMQEYMPILDALPCQVILTKYEEIIFERNEEERMRQVSVTWFQQLENPFASLGEVTSFVLQVCEAGRNELSSEEGEAQCARCVELIEKLEWRKDVQDSTFMFCSSSIFVLELFIPIGTLDSDYNDYSVYGMCQSHCNHLCAPYIIC